MITSNSVTLLETRNDIITFGVCRGILSPGSPAKSIVTELKKSSETWPFNSTRITVFSVILDVIERRRSGRNLAHNGYFRKITGDHWKQDVFERNSRRFFRLLMEEHSEQVALEEVFLARFVTENTELSPEAKKLMTWTASVCFGPWHVKNHVHRVSENEGRITVAHTNGEAYYYL